jgi:Derlin-2/3
MSYIASLMRSFVVSFPFPSSPPLSLAVACALDIITPFHLYFNWRAIYHQGELWRLVTNFLFFGTFGVDFFLHMYFLCRYCRSLEEGNFSGRSADFLFCLLFGMTLLMFIAPFMPLMFYGSSLTFMLVYLWGRRNPHMQVSLLGLVHFQAPYLPWVLLAFSVLLGHDMTSDALGIVVGHVFYYFKDVWPAIAAARGWRFKRVLATPKVIHLLFGTQRRDPDDIIIVDGQAAG